MTALHRILALAAITLGLAAAFADFRSVADASAAGLAQLPRSALSALDLADRIVNRDGERGSVVVFDLRPSADYELLHVAGARSASPDDLDRESLPADATVVVYGDDDRQISRAMTMLRERGQHEVFYLREGVSEWIGRVLEPRLAVDATAAERAEFERAAQLSRFFGGVPRAGVARADLPLGYWTGTPQAHGRSADAARQAIARIRRRGC